MNKHEKQLDKYDSYSEVELLKEILIVQNKQLRKLEKTRSNTSTLVWWLIAIPIIIGILMLITGSRLL